MKKRVLSLLCALLFVIGVSLPASASDSVTPYGSKYFSSTDVRIYAEGNGTLLIEFDVNATHTMLEVGSTYIYLYEQQSNGSYQIVHTFTSVENYSAMMNTNSPFCSGDVYYYNGIPGVNYYAKCTFYARDSYGSEARMYNTWAVTCT